MEISCQPQSAKPAIKPASLLDHPDRSPNSRRRLLHASICAILYEKGFQSATNSAIETLTEMIQSFICELGRSTQSLAEQCGRSEPLFVDAFIAMVEMGISTSTLIDFGRQSNNRIVFPPPQVQTRQQSPKILQAGERRSLAHYIPDHFPPFPDAHSYIRTPTYKQPVTEYEAIREKASSQKRDVERALTRFMAKTCEQSTSHSLFPDELSSNNGGQKSPNGHPKMSPVFPLISLNLKNHIYLSALLPRDQIFDHDDDEDSMEGVNKKNDDQQSSDKQLDGGEMNGVEEMKDSQDDLTNGEMSMSRTEMDTLNPFLRPTKICRRQKRNEN